MDFKYFEQIWIRSDQKAIYKSIISKAVFNTHFYNSLQEKYLLRPHQLVILQGPKPF